VRHRTRMLALLVGAAAVAGLAAGCGGSSAAPPANAAGGNGFAAYTQCLARNGVVLPSLSANPRADRTGGVRPSGRPSNRPSGGTGNGGGFGGFAGFGNQPPAGVDQATWDKAMQACASVRPSGGAGGGANNSALVAYRNCLTEHGVTLPSGGPRGGAGGGLAGLNTADPTVAAAVTACAPLRPSGGPPRTTPAP
jgi:hypothetical protein